MNHQSISIHLLRRTAALTLLIAFAQSSWGDVAYYYYNKYAQIEVVPSQAGKVYAETHDSSTHDQYMKSETGSTVNFKYCVSAGYDKMWFTLEPEASGVSKIYSYKIINKAQNGTADNAPSLSEIIAQEYKTASANASNKYEIEISTKQENVTEEGDATSHDGVLYGRYYGTSYPDETQREELGWDTYPNAYVYFYCGQTITDKEDLPTRDEDSEYVYYDRTFLKGWNSVCLPFKITVDDFKATLGEGCKLATFKEYNAAESKIVFEKVDEVAAGVPCIVWSDNDNAPVSLSISTTERGYVATPDNTTALKGSFTKASVGKGKLKLANENTFAPTTADDAVTYPFRAYVEVPEGSAKALTIGFDGETTAISTAETAETASATVYTAGGVQAKSTVRGLNIVKTSDGRVKKVMVK
jgi:hypothetical protein